MTVKLPQVLTADNVVELPVNQILQNSSPDVIWLTGVAADAVARLGPTSAA
jgi:hypothetical protein